jgi:hypothetical protein
LTLQLGRKDVSEKKKYPQHMEVSYRDTELKAILIFQDLIIKPFAVA